ncbi:MAG: hypothetical protein H6832_01045 [Planctomycetes bacterium]|nr:hypothetical protein [Planctomycetota bacterium]MCB9891069.1 hypothetical protein [Planctomycetota bacterium]MCB9916970.1 hypothetical protein [Planctomycetota bacterium]
MNAIHTSLAAMLAATPLFAQAKVVETKPEVKVHVGTIEKQLESPSEIDKLLEEVKASIETGKGRIGKLLRDTKSVSNVSTTSPEVAVLVQDSKEKSKKKGDDQDSHEDEEHAIRIHVDVDGDLDLSSLKELGKIKSDVLHVVRDGLKDLPKHKVFNIDLDDLDVGKLELGKLAELGKLKLGKLDLQSLAKDLEGLEVDVAHIGTDLEDLGQDIARKVEIKVEGLGKDIEEKAEQIARSLSSGFSVARVGGVKNAPVAQSKAAQDKTKRAMEHLREAEEALRRAMLELGNKQVAPKAVRNPAESFRWIQKGDKDSRANPLERVLELRRAKKDASDAKDKKNDKALDWIEVVPGKDGKPARVELRRSVNVDTKAEAKETKDARVFVRKAAPRVLVTPRVEKRQDVRMRKNEQGETEVETIIEIEDVDEPEEFEEETEEVQERREAAQTRRVAARDRAEAARVQAEAARNAFRARTENAREARRQRVITDRPTDRATPRRASGAHEHPDLWRELESLRREVDRIRGEMNKLERRAAPAAGRGRVSFQPAPLPTQPAPPAMPPAPVRVGFAR